MSLNKLLKLAESPGIDPDCRAWLQLGIGRYVDGGESLESCLDVKQEGALMFEIRRDKHLRRAARCLEAASPWSRAVLLSKEAKRFEAIIWRRWKLKADPPADASQLRRHLFYARREKQIPGSIRQLYRILTD